MDDTRFSYIDNDRAGDAGLDAFVRAHPQGSPYHLSAWRRAVQDAYGYRGRALAATRPDGTVAGMLPFCLVEKPWGRPRWVSLPYCDLGGALAGDAGLEQALVQRACADLAAAGASGLDLRRSAASIADEGPLLEGRKVRMLLDLPDTAEQLMQAYPPKLRSQIRKAEKNGLSASIDTSAAAIDDFYYVYSRNMRRLGSPPHSRRWFEALHQAYGGDNGMFIALVRHEGKVVGAGWVLMAGTRAVIPWASTLAEANPLAPNMLLYWTIQAHLCALGIRQFDFGRSTYGEGTYKFKKQWGAQPCPLEWEQWQANRPQPEPEQPARAGGKLRPLIEETWQKLPLAVTNTLGPRLRRYITL